MTDYIGYPIETNPDDLAQDAFDYISANVPDWEPHDGQFEVWLIEALSQMAAEARDVASDVPVTIFRYFGASILNLPPIDAAAASVNSTWTMVDTAGYTIEEGTVVGIPSAGELIPFEVDADVTIAPGSASTPAGSVVLRAQVEGEEANGLSGTPELIDTNDDVTSIALVGSTSDGVDAEEDAAYLARLAAELQLLTPRPILPQDFAVLARRVAGVDRATAIDGYNPTGPLTNQERTVSVAVIDEDGEAVSTAVKNEVDALLEAEREVNFDVFVIDPTYTIIDVNVTVMMYAGWDSADVDARVGEALAEYLSPANWGLPVTGETREWTNVQTVRHTELISEADRVEGVHYVDSLTFGVQGGTISTGNTALNGAAALPRPGTINVTVQVP